MSSSKDKMYWDRFDIVEAHYIFCRDWHGGQWSKLYARMCHISKYFKPSPNLEYETLTENGQAIYDKLEADMIESRFAESEKFLEDDDYE